MKKNKIIIILMIASLNIFFLEAKSEINNSIVIKVGGALITSIDIQNEILTSMLISKQEISQESIDINKKFAIKALINTTLKRSEIEKNKVIDYSKKDLQVFLDKVAKDFNTNQKGLKNIFKQNNLSYESFVEKNKIELLWNTLIYTIYKNQININVVEVDNDLEKFKGNKSEEELKKLRQNILNSKRENQLSLFSRSHLSSLESTVPVNFQ